jgi:uncharacterized membrane protein HdeD (DUF308 family)
MSTTKSSVSADFSSLMGALRKQSGWSLAFGVVLLILGIIALVYAAAAGVASMILFGWVLVVAGLFQGVHAIRHRGHEHLLVHVLNSLLSIVVGVMLLSSPALGAAVFTLLLALYFVVTGVFRIVTALSRHASGSGWMTFEGLLTLILGIILWALWPSGALWVVGLFIGIDLLIVGWIQVMLAMTLRETAGAR